MSSRLNTAVLSREMWSFPLLQLSIERPSDDSTTEPPGNQVGRFRINSVCESPLMIAQVARKAMKLSKHVIRDKVVRLMPANRWDCP
jgi:hypothetical protein